MNTCTSNLQTQLNGKQASGSYLSLTGGVMQSNIEFSPTYGTYGVNWTPSGDQIDCYLGDMYFNVHSKNFFFPTNRI